MYRIWLPMLRLGSYGAATTRAPRTALAGRPPYRHDTALVSARRMALSFHCFVIRPAARTKLFGSRSRWRAWLIAVVAIGCAAIVSVAPAGAADVDPSKMSADAIKALEQRLIDAGCYLGAIDGQTSGALN